MQIFIQLSNGKTVTIDIHPDMYTLKDLLTYIKFSVLDIEFEQFDLILDDRRITSSNQRIADSCLRQEQTWKIAQSLSTPAATPGPQTQPSLPFQAPIQVQKNIPPLNQSPVQFLPSQQPQNIIQQNPSTNFAQQPQQPPSIVQQNPAPKVAQQPQQPQNILQSNPSTNFPQQPQNIQQNQINLGPQFSGPKPIIVPNTLPNPNIAPQQNPQFQQFVPQQVNQNIPRFPTQPINALPNQTINALPPQHQMQAALSSRMQTIQPKMGTINNPNALFQNTERSLRAEISALQKTIEEQEEQIQSKDDEIRKLKEKIRQLEAIIEDLTNKHKRVVNELEDEIDEKDIKYRTLFKRSQEYEYRLRVLRTEKDDLQCELDDFKYRQAQLTKYQQEQTSSSDPTINISELLAIVDAQKQSIQRLQQQVVTQRQLIENPEVNVHQIELEQKVETLEIQLQQSQSNYSLQLDEMAQLRRQLKIKENDIQLLNTTNEDQIQNFLKLRAENQALKRDLQRLQEEFAEQQDENDYYRQVMEERVANLKSNMTASQISTDDGDDRLLYLEQKRLAREAARKEAQLKEEEALRLAAEKKRIQREETERNSDAVLQRTKQQRQEMAMKMQQKFLNSHGQMEICFLVDITASMDPYKQQTIQCIEGSMQQIKAETGRDVNWAVVAYQDFNELQGLGGKYKQLDFTKDQNAVKTFMRGLECLGGEDPPEDIRGGILQALKLKWTKEFKLIILITDSPCHGKKYTNGLADDYPHTEDINDAINMLIQQEVVFIGINFTTLTQHMYKEFAKVYLEKNKQDLLIQVDMIKMKEGEIWKEMIALITQGAATATNTNKKETKSKTKQNQVKKLLVKEGAMEALCKSENPSNFETKVDVDVRDFEVFRVELKEEALQNKLKSIHKLDTGDFNTFKEGSWKCIRTQKPFAFGMMKAVYLMKKQNDPNNHLYVIKTPLDGTRYMTLEDAIKECRSHLLCKRLMQNFNRELKERQLTKNDRTVYPDIMYSDFLILKERNDMYWIAERYFNGEFVKYNNNNGYINSDLTQYNQLAQAFTYYSYIESDFTFMINDVQGVDRFFTDPAVNTTSGNFDETDIGEDGIAMFIVNFQRKKVICEKILNLLDLKVD